MAATRAGAQAKFNARHELADPLVGLARVYNALGDLSGYPIDGPVPDPTAPVRTRHEAATLRGELGLKPYVNRWVSARETAGAAEWRGASARGRGR